MKVDSDLGHNPPGRAHKETLPGWKVGWVGVPWTAGQFRLEAGAPRELWASPAVVLDS